MRELRMAKRSIEAMGGELILTAKFPQCTG
jgi:hypothetical protein